MAIHRKHILNGSVLVAGILGANFLNFLFNALLGRWLSLENFSLITLIVTFYYVAAIFTNTLSSTMSFMVAKLIGKGEHGKVAAFVAKTVRNSMVAAVIVSIIWLALIPVLMSFFHIATALPLIAFVPIILGSTYTYSAIGYFSGTLEFLPAGILYIVEPATKLISGVLLTFLGFGLLAYFSLPISLACVSICAAFLYSWLKKNDANTKVSTPFPKHFFTHTLFASIGNVLFFSADLLLVRHFFSATQSGQYALISLIGKMMYFLCILPNMFTIPLAARNSDRKKLNQIFLSLIAAAGGLAIMGWLTLTALGPFLIPILFGSKVLPILNLLPIYTLGIGLFSTASVIVSFHLAKQEYFFSYFSIGAGLLLSVLILLNHSDLTAVTTNIAITSLILLVTVITAHIYRQKTPQYAKI